MTLFNKARILYDRFTYSCAILSTVSIIVIMFAVVLDTSLRIFKIPIYGVFELNGLLVGINIYLGIAYTQQTRQHISVTIFNQRLSKRLKAAINIPLLSVSILFFLWLAYMYSGHAYVAFLSGEAIPGFVQFPVFPLKFTMFLGVFLLSVQLLIDLLNDIRTLTTKR